MVKRLRAAEVVEAPQHAHQRVVGRLERNVVELVPAEVGQRRAPASDLEARRAEEQRMQARDRLVTNGAVGAQVA